MQTHRHARQSFVTGSMILLWYMLHHVHTYTCIIKTSCENIYTYIFKRTWGWYRYQLAGWDQERHTRYSARYKQLSRSLQSSRTNLFCVVVHVSVCVWACGHECVYTCAWACLYSDIPLQLFANSKGYIRSASWVLAASRVDFVLQDVPW